MELLGKWKLKGIYLPSESGMSLITRENATGNTLAAFEAAAKLVIEFSADGSMDLIAKSEGEVASFAKREGYSVRDDGYCVTHTARWEERDGRIFYDNGKRGTLFAAGDPFVELHFTEDGCMLYNFGMCIYEHE